MVVNYAECLRRELDKVMSLLSVALNTLQQIRLSSVFSQHSAKFFFFAEYQLTLGKNFTKCLT